MLRVRNPALSLHTHPAQVPLACHLITLNTARGLKYEKNAKCILCSAIHMRSDKKGLLAWRKWMEFLEESMLECHHVERRGILHIWCVLGQQGFSPRQFTIHWHFGGKNVWRLEALWLRSGINQELKEIIPKSNTELEPSLTWLDIPRSVITRAYLQHGGMLLIRVGPLPRWPEWWREQEFSHHLS